jgi:hypothetical protein
MIRATRIVTDSLKKNLEGIAGKHTVNLLLGTSHMVQKALQPET